MSAAIGHRPTPSVDEDLQKLYNEVWAGFSDEQSAPSRAPSAQDDLDNIYSVYGTEPDYQPQSSTTPVSPASARSCALLIPTYSIPSLSLSHSRAIYYFCTHSSIICPQHGSNPPVATDSYHPSHLSNLSIRLFYSRNGPLQRNFASRSLQHRLLCFNIKLSRHVQKSNIRQRPEASTSTRATVQPVLGQRFRLFHPIAKLRIHDATTLQPYGSPLTGI